MERAFREMEIKKYPLNFFMFHSSLDFLSCMNCESRIGCKLKFISLFDKLIHSLVQARFLLNSMPKALLLYPND